MSLPKLAWAIGGRDVAAQSLESLAIAAGYGREQAYAADSNELDYALVGLGEAALALAQLDDARGSFARVVAGRECEGKHLGLLARAEFGLARIDVADGHLDSACELGRRALDDMRHAPALEQGMLASIEAAVASWGP